MRKLSINDLRQRLFEVADQVLDSGIPIAITHRSRTLLLLPEEAYRNSRLSALKRRKLVRKDAPALEEARVVEWRELKNLDGPIRISKRAF